jgi:hypothetical protein
MELDKLSQLKAEANVTSQAFEVATRIVLAETARGIERTPGVIGKRVKDIAESVTAVLLAKQLEILKKQTAYQAELQKELEEVTSKT